jgi:hypothetical protein
MRAPRNLAPAVGALALALALGAAPGAAFADGDAPLALRVVDPPVVGYEVTALGRATHPLRVVVTNRSPRPASVTPLALRFVPTRDGITFPCDDPAGRDERWPASLEGGESFTLPQTIACTTPLPGRYEVEVRARPRGAPASAERSYGTFPLQIEPGPNPPVALPWEPALRAAASGTKDMRPSTNPAAARIVVAVVNGSRAPVALAPLHAVLRVTRRGSSIQACPDRVVDLAFTGTLAAGHMRALPMPLGCDISTEALYDVDVSVTNASGGRVRIATHVIRVTVNAPSSPGPADDQRSSFAGGSGT